MHFFKSLRISSEFAPGTPPPTFSVSHPFTQVLKSLRLWHELRIYGKNMSQSSLATLRSISNGHHAKWAFIKYRRKEERTCWAFAFMTACEAENAQSWIPNYCLHGCLIILLVFNHLTVLVHARCDVLQPSCSEVEC